ncbi:MAG: FAD-dependent monooxygenase [Acidobacteriota bacterium]|jgi:flavin-dependent dehydrogenase
MSVSLAAVANRRWDAVVIGAGPAGALEATLLARRGLAVLLVDKATFPRPKVCGGCLNAAALAALRAAGLGDLPWQLGARQLDRLQVYSRRQRATVSLQPGAGISRGVLDAGLAAAASTAGVTFVDSTRAHAGFATDEGRPVHLSRNGERATVQANVVVIASGLGPLPIEDADQLPALVAPIARLGAGAQAPHAPPQVPHGVIVMVIGEGGYVGLVRVENDGLNVGAAFDGEFVRRAGGLGEAAAALVEAADAPLAHLLRSLRWRGTPPLTFHRRGLARERLFVLGDAAGYVEPFTGEGMAWALTGALALASLVAAAAVRWDEQLGRRWESEHARRVGRRRRLCRAVASGLRRPWLTGTTLQLLRVLPQLAAPAVRAINASPRLLAEP